MRSGTSAVEIAQQYCRYFGCGKLWDTSGVSHTRVELTTAKDHERTRKLWKREGFVAQGSEAFLEVICCTQGVDTSHGGYTVPPFLARQLFCEGVFTLGAAPSSNRALRVSGRLRRSLQS